MTWVKTLFPSLKIVLSKDPGYLIQTGDCMVGSDISMFLRSRHLDPNGANPCIAGAGYVTLKAVAHHQGLQGSHPEFTQQVVKNLRFGLSNTVFT